MYIKGNRIYQLIFTIVLFNWNFVKLGFLTSRYNIQIVTMCFHRKTLAEIAEPITSRLQQ